MWGVNTLGNMATGSAGTSQNTTDNNFTLNVVKTSSTNVETIEGTDVSDIVSEAENSIVAVNTVIQTTSRIFLEEPIPRRCRRWFRYYFQ